MESGKDIFDVYEFQFFLNNFSGYNTIDFREKWHQLLYSIVYIFLNAVLVMNNVICFYLIYQTQDDPKEFIYVVTMTISTSVSSLNVFITEVYKKEIHKLHNELTRSLRSSEIEKSERFREVKARLEKKFVMICKAFYPLSVVAMIAFIAFPALIPGERLIPYLFPVKNLSSPYYEGVYVFQAFILIFFISNVISFDFICNGFTIRVCTCLDIIASRLDGCREFFPGVDYSEYVEDYYDPETVPLRHKNNNYFVDNSVLVNKKGQSFERATKEMREFLKRNIRLHQKVMGQLETIDEIYNISTVLRLLMGTVVFAIAASVVFSDNFIFLRDIRLGGYALGGFFNLFIYCYCGSHVFESGERVAFALYSLPWYEMDIETRKIVLFAFMKSRKIKGITAGKIFKLDLELFLQVLKFAHSFITLLKKF